MIGFGGLKKNQPGTQNKAGLDIGSSSVKLMEISLSASGSKLLGLGLRKVSHAVRQPLIEAIKSLSEEINMTTKEVNMSVSGPSVIVRFVSMPKMKDEELKSAVRFEAEKYIPFAINDCIVDHQILKRNEKENKLDILLVAVKKEIITDRLAIAEECGYSVGTVDVDTFAVANSFLKNNPQPDQDKAAALINIGAAYTNIGIVSNGTLHFARDIAVGGDDLSQGSKSSGNNLIDEMRLSFSYYENQRGKGVDEIYISGGGIQLSGLEAIFQESFGSKPGIWNPLKFLDTTGARADADILEKMKGSFAVAAGLTLR